MPVSDACVRHPWKIRRTDPLPDDRIRLNYRVMNNHWLALLLVLPLAAQESPTIQEMKSGANAFLGLLDETQRAKATFPFDADARENFRFTPQVRTGLSLRELDESQRAAAIKLLHSVLSDQGRLKAMQIIQLESVLAEIDANHIHTTWRDINGDFGRDILADHYHRHDKDHGDH
jgi:hypothetical protein